MVNNKIAKQPNSNLRRGNPAWGNKNNGTGKSGNPNGKKSNHVYITSLLKEMLDQEADYIAPGAMPSDTTWRQMIARAMLIESSKGNVPMIKELLDRVEGKVMQLIGGGNNGEPIRVEIDYKHKIIIALSRYGAGGGESKDSSEP